VTLTRERLLTECEACPDAVAEYPFGPEARVYKVAGRMFALVAERSLDVSLKCDPALAEILRERYAAVAPGYHLNKRHWNTVTVDGTVPDDEVVEMIRHSYDLVVSSLTRAQRAALSPSAKRI
jgi:predicted DNA-binding protein (MmcQ/YjbR family)